MTGVPSKSAAERRLTGLRERLGGSFDKTCVIRTPTKVPNGAGGWRDGPPAESDPIRCEVRFPTSTPQTPENQAADTSLSRAEIRLPVGTDVSVESQIVVGPTTYEVKGHDVGRSFATEVVCDCVRAGDGA